MAAAIQRHAVAPVPPVPPVPPPRLSHRPPNPSWHLPATLLAGVLLPRQSQRLQRLRRLWRLWRLARGVSRCPECWQPQPVPRMSQLRDFRRQLRQGEPAVLRDPEGADLVEKYNFEYLESQMKGSDWRVHLVPKGQRFQRVYGQGVGEGMVTTMSFPDFAGKSVKSDAPHAYYMQVPFSGRPLESLGTDPYGSDMRDDRRRVLQWLRKLTEEAELGELDNNQLWIGRGGNLTPCHYDKAENLHLQICGRKTFLLIPPEQTFAVYPYPIDHPLDSFSMVDFDSPDFQRFNDFADVQAFQVTLEPGDLLYLPKYWWHQVAQGSGDNVSLNFWCAERQADQMSIFQETSPRCRPLLAHRFLEDFTGGMVRRLHAAKALPSSFTAARLLSELGSGWAEDTPEGLRRLGSMVRGRLAELMGDISEEELAELLRGTCAGDRLLVEIPPATEVTTASQGDLGGWFSKMAAAEVVEFVKIRGQKCSGMASDYC